MRRRFSVSLGDPFLDYLLGGAARGYLIIVAGNPGTGKTIFSAQCAYRNILRGLKAAYISLAEPREVFLRCMEGLGMKFKRLEEKGLFKFLDLASPTDPSFMDRMLEVSLKEVLDFKADVLVVDSLSALLQLTEREKARSLVHNLFTRVIRAGGVTTVAVVEVPRGEKRIGLGVEEFIADMVFFLVRREIEARLGRQLEVVKARGVEVKYPRMLYTLHGGFKTIPPFSFKPPRYVEPFKPIEDFPNAYSTGVSDLDAMLGGYPKRGVVHLEIGENVEVPMYHLFAATPLVNFIVKGRGVLLFPTTGVDAGIVHRAGRSYGLADESLRKCVRVVQLGPPSPGMEDWVVEVKGASFKEDYKQWLTSLRTLQEVTGSKEVAVFIGADSVYHQYGEDCMHRFLSLEALRTRMEGGLLLIATKPGLESRAVKAVSNVADVHLKLVRRRGALLIYGLKPRTELHAVSVDVSQGYPIPKLTPMV